MNRNLQALAWVGVVATTMIVHTGCAQKVGDIDRVTAIDYQKRSDFTGVWYMRQTVIDVPGDVGGPFVGIASEMEKVRFDFHPNAMTVYRAYERIPGYDKDAGEKIDGETQYADGVDEGWDDEYKEAPLFSYTVNNYFDIQRQYNTATGEQSNIIAENMTDRLWHERDFFHVNWASDNLSASLESFMGRWTGYGTASIRNIQSVQGSDDAYYQELNEDGELEYFDFVNLVNVNGAEMKVRTSFWRQREYQRDYEPVYYDDEMMTKFGYFRTERLVYDRQYGFHDDRYIRLANRHDLWVNDFKRDENGAYVRDAEGRRIPTPMAERTPKPVVYYLSPNYPEDMRTGAQAVADDWDVAFTRAAAAAKGVEPAKITEDYGKMFLMCENIITEDAEAGCDPRPEDQRRDAEGNFIDYKIRAGDLRRSFIFWVHQPQASGPLGYGPSYPDPETGEIVSGTAYVYGASVDTYAQSAVNMIRFINGETTEDDVREGDDVLDLIMARADNVIDPRARVTGGELDQLPADLRDLPIEEMHGKLLRPEQLERLEAIQTQGFEALAVNPNHVNDRFDKMKAAGVDRRLLDDEAVRALSGGQLDPAKLQAADIDKLLTENNPLDMIARQKVEQERLDFAARHNIYMAEFADPAVIGTALEYKGRTDYDVIWNEIRNRIFHGVMAHEVGHTIGLRHNFQGSYDSANYFDDYWESRKENFKQPVTVGELYEVNAISDDQANADMTRYQYSTIMDYHSRFNSDFSGIGKYDEAAILFAYTFGTYDDIDEDNEEPIVAEPGYVEVFEDIPEDHKFTIPGDVVETLTRDYLRNFDDRYAPSQHPLEDVHYTTYITALGGPDAVKNRSIIKYDDLLAQREDYLTKREALDDELVAQIGTIDTVAKYNQYIDGVAALEEAPVEVPYMFCSDEWRGATISCDTWDLGSDPLEIVQSSVTRYYAYYPFTHFRRGRLSFSSLSGASSAARSFNIMPFVYQQWVFDRYYSNDDTLSNYYLLAAYAGLNFLKDVVTMPSYGAYTFDAEEDMYRLISYDAEYESDSADLRVYPGEGRRQFSRYDYGSGYYYFTRVTEAGHYWDYVFALTSLTASVATALGVDTQADFRSYSLPYYLLFEDEMTTLFNGLFRESYDDISPRVLDGKMLRVPLAALQYQGQFGPVVFDPFSGSPMPNDMSSTKPIDIRINFSQRFYAILYSMAFFGTNYSKHYIDQARVFRIGNGESVAAPAGSGYELVSFTDPFTGISYGALNRDGDAEGSGLGAEMVIRGRELVEILNTTNSQEAFNNAYYELSQLIEDMGMVIDAVSIFNTNL